MFNVKKMYEEEMMSFTCEIESLTDIGMKKQLYALLLCWHKEIYNYKLEDMRSFFDKVKNKKLSINFKPIETYVNIAIKKNFWRAWEEMMLDLTPAMVVEKMGNMFEKYSEQPETSQKEKAVDFEYEVGVKPKKKVIDIPSFNIASATVVSALVEVYGSVSSAKTFITKNGLNPTDTDWKKAVEIIAKSTSKYKNKAKELLEI